MKLLVDKSSILGAFLHLSDPEYGEDYEAADGKLWHVPDVDTCVERFTTSLDNILKTTDLKPSDIILVNDPGKPCKQRRKIIKDYKEKEVIAPKEFFIARSAFFDTVESDLKTKGAISATPTDQQEADDLINELSIRLPETIIWTRDKDLLACPTDVLLQEKGGVTLNPEKFPVPDKYIHCYRTIVQGDKSDGLGSCKGFGAVAWDKMIDTFGEIAIENLDHLLQNKELDDLSEDVDQFKKLQLIIDQAANLHKIYACMKFLPVPAHQVKWEGAMPVTEGTLVTKKNFDEVYQELKNINFDYSVIDYETDVTDESRKWCEASGVKIDVMGSELCGMGLRICDRNYYFSVDHADTDNISLDNLEQVLELICEKRVYAHNFVGFEHPVTWTHFGTMLEQAFDTQLMASYVDENDYMNLKHLSKRWLGYNQTTYSDTLAGRSGMRELSGEEVLGYGLDDVITTDLLQQLFTTILQYENTYETFKKVEVPAAYFSALCFINGANFSEEKFKGLKRINDANTLKAWAKLNMRLLEIGWEGGVWKPLKGKNARTFNALYEAVHGTNPGVSSVKAGMRQFPDSPVTKAFEQDIINKLYKTHWEPRAEFNPRSSVQMGKLLYDILGCKERIHNPVTQIMKKKGKTQGSPATNEAAIKNAIAYKDTLHVDILELLMEYKGYLTKESLFLSKWPSYVHWKDSKIHCSLKQSATTTRRAAHAAPNMGQLPKKKGKEFRNMMTIPDDGWYLWALDIDSQELILQAWASQDANFLSCYQGGEKKDIHSLTGYKVALKQGADFDSFEDFFRQKKGKAGPFRVTGKAVNFATAYLCKAPKLAQMICVTEREAELFIRAKGEAFPELMPAVMEYIKLCAKRGYSETFLGARRHLAGKKHFGSKKNHEKEAAGRLAWSFRIQSSGAEQIKLSGGRMYMDGLFDDGLCLPVTAIHDEIVGIIHESVLDERMPKLIDCICQPYADMAIKTTTTPEIGKHFGELKEWKPRARRM